MKRQPDDVAIWVQLGHAEKEIGRFEAAETAYRRAAAIAHDDPEPVLHLAHLLRRQARVQDAFQAFQRLEHLAPSAEVSNALRQLGRLRRARVAMLTGAGATLIVVEDYLASLHDEPVNMPWVEPSLVTALLTSDLEIYFIVNDGSDRSGEPRFLALDKAAMFAIVRYASRSDRDPRALDAMMFDARNNATLITAGPGSFIVLVGRIWGRGNEVIRFLEPCARGARLVAYIDEIDIDGIDPVVPCAQAEGGWRNSWQALAELAHAADALVTASNRQRDQLLKLLGRYGIQGVSVVGLTEEQAPGGLANTFRGITGPVLRSLRRGERSTRSVRAGFGPQLITALRTVGATCPVRRRMRFPTLSEGTAFRPGAPVRNVHRSAAYLADPLQLIFGPTFHRLDSVAAWISGDDGRVAFRVNSETGAEIAVLVALAVAPSAIGSAFSIAFIGSADHQRRWMTLTGEEEFVRIDGRVPGNGVCDLQLHILAHEKVPEGGDEDEPPAVRAVEAIGVTAIGYCQQHRAGAVRDLRERLVFA